MSRISKLAENSLDFTNETVLVNVYQHDRANISLHYPVSIADWTLSVASEFVLASFTDPERPMSFEAMKTQPVYTEPVIRKTSAEAGLATVTISERTFDSVTLDYDQVSKVPCLVVFVRAQMGASASAPIESTRFLVRPSRARQ